MEISLVSVSPPYKKHLVETDRETQSGLAGGCQRGGRWEEGLRERSEAISTDQ